MTALLSPDQLRQKYLDFFATQGRFDGQGHAIVPSSPLIPENDPTTLFTGSGMQPMMPYLLGAQHPKGKLIVDSQKCFRSQDIEEVGDNRHTTFFEMLGNWSLGAYFKAEQLRWFFTFLVDEVGLDAHKLFVSVFRGKDELGIPRDSEAVEIWKALFTERQIDAKDVDFSERDGMADGHIFYYDEQKNWWSRAGTPQNMPFGEPGGPDSEVFYDFGAERLLHESSPFSGQNCHVNCDCGRFLEIGNNVFMTYLKTEEGFELLKQKNIDFGGGFERILAAMNNEPDVFKTELFKPIVLQIAQACGNSVDPKNTQMDDKNYYPSARAFASPEDQKAWVEKSKKATRIIADHIKAATFLAADGVFPSNKAQGYVSRRLLRRAIRYADSIGITSAFVPKLVETVADMYKNSYPAVFEQLAAIKTVFQDEELKFRKTLAAGLKVLAQTEHVDGKIAFDLYQTYGFPLELTTEILQQKNKQLDIEMFQTEFQKHKDLSRSASAGKFKGGLADHSEVTTKYHTATHLLHAALRKVLGTHVQQKGSNLTSERLRFDFSHPAPLTTQQLKEVEQLINDWVSADLPVTMRLMQKHEALQSGAVAFFLEKYPDEVSVYTIGKDADTDWISKEFCGGPHVTHTGAIGPLKMVKEQSASAGVRRIYMELIESSTAVQAAI